MNAQNRYDLQRLQRHLDEVWEEQQAERRGHQVPRSKKTEELDVDDILDEIEDEEFDDLDEEDDPTVTRKAKKGRARKTSAKKKSSAKVEEDGVGTADVAEAAGTDSRSLRMLLRAEFPKEEGGRYHWSSLNHPEVKAIIKRVKSGGTKEAKAASLENLKKSKAKKTTAKSKAPASKSDAAKKRAAARRKARRAAEAEDDE